MSAGARVAGAPVGGRPAEPTDDEVRIPSRPPARWDRRGWWIGAAVLVVASVARAGVDVRDLLNPRGFNQFGDFFTAMVRPELGADFVWLAVREAGVTLGYALLGTALAIVIGVIGGPLLTERVWLSASGEHGRRRWIWWGLRAAFAVPRSMHEVIFGLILVSILGLDPLVAVLAIGIPFGSVTAKVFAELLDEAPRGAESTLRSMGASRMAALVVATVPYALGDVVSYGFYRFECAIRSAAVLGIVGAGGLGFQIALSFQTLRYDEMWTLLWALIALSGLADAWSSLVRSRRAATGVEMHAQLSTVPPRRDRVLVASAVAFVAAVPVAWWLLDLHLSSLWSQRARTLGAELFDEAWPPSLGSDGLGGLVSDSVDTVALAVLALVLAWTLASVLAFVAARPRGASRPWVTPRTVVGVVVRAVLLVARSVPPPVWAFLTVFVLRPGLWPGVAALAVYNLGVLGRLQGEVVENLDDRPGEVLRSAGATPFGVAAVATVPAVSGRFTALGLYRWEVAIRETVIVGVVGAAGLGRTIEEQSARFDYDGILASIGALLVVTLMVDVVSSGLRRTIR
ncbi:PhnE/PtxC family ABC transporter permease [Ilumatobacter sp.]|uniref:PhnE/PtxC family ABC transporter permease n=1 Tax=Ilumatobacter sp. TaxID=1967498 RepID=UPI003B51BB9C